MRWGRLDDALVVDEASMIDLPLADALMQAVAVGTRLILVGDVDQLPSVGGVEPSHVDAGDLHPHRDHVRSGGVEVVGVRSARRQCEAAHGEQ